MTPSMGQPLTHSKWVRGLQAGFDRFSQPKGSLARISNLLFTKRGALKVCDGTMLISSFNGALQNLAAKFGAILELFLFQPMGASSGYFAIYKDYAANLPAPASLAAVAGAAGVLTGNYKYVVTALDGDGGETTKSNEASVSLTAQKGSLTWTAVPNAAGYNVYRTVAGGATGTEHLVGPATTNAFIDNVADGSLGGQTPPAQNNTQQCQFVAVPATNYSNANIVKTLPADNLPNFGPPSGGYGGGGSGHSGGQSPTAQGGTVGAISPLPQILGFINKMMLILGNGITPYQSDGTTAGTVQLTNTFTATYPLRAASTVYSQGDQIEATVGGTDYVFTAIQGGQTSAGAAPTFPSVLGQTVIDGTGSPVIWKNSGQVSGSPAPRGAANAEVYAGSLWVANTSPTETADQLDGPSALRQSDLNNPNSWNPLNAAQISPDDGDQNNGLKAFTVAAAGIAPQNWLMYFKNFSTYLIQGVFGSSNFAITRLQTDLGCVASRTLEFVPGFGIMRLSHLGFAVTDGINDKLENPEAIRPYLFQESEDSDITPVDWSYIYFSKACQTANPPMYCCALPILPVVAGSIAGVSASIIGGGGLPSGSYFVKAYLIRNDGKYLYSGEITVSGGAGTGIVVTLPVSNTIGNYWLVYFGIGAGGQDQFVQVPSFEPGVTITQQGISGVPGSSNGWLQRIFSYDLVLKAWTVVDLPFPISTLRQFRAVGSIPITVMGGFWDSGIRRWQAGDATWDAGATNNFAATTDVLWSFQDSEVTDEAGTRKLFCNQMIMRGTTVPKTIDVALQTNGFNHSVSQDTVTPLGNGLYEDRVQIFRTFENMHATISGSGPTTIESTSYEVTQKPVGSELVFS